MAGTEYSPMLDVLKTLSEYQQKLKGEPTYLSFVAVNFHGEPAIKLRAESWTGSMRHTNEQLIRLQELKTCNVKPSEYVERKLNNMVESLNYNYDT